MYKNNTTNQFFTAVFNKSLLFIHVCKLFIATDPTTAAGQANKEEVDSRSVFVGNVSFMFVDILSNTNFTIVLDLVAHYDRTS